jgi:hypothetical protein
MLINCEGRLWELCLLHYGNILCNLAECLSLSTYVGVVTQGFGSVIIELEQDGLEDTLSTRIRKVFRSNLSWDTGYPDILRRFLSFLQANSGIVGASFQIHSNSSSVFLLSNIL